MRSVIEYIQILRGFNRNAKLFLVHTALSGLGLAFLALLYNLYILSLGFKQDMIGLITLVACLVAVVAALPLGYITNRLGYRRALIVAAIGTALSIALPLLIPTHAVLLGTELLWGVAFTQLVIVGGPFMSDNAKAEQRAHLFSFQFALAMGTAFIGNLLGGELPRFFGNLLQVGAETPSAYQAALGVSVALIFASALPLWWLKPPVARHTGVPLARPHVMVRPRVQVARLLLPQFVGTLGAGMFTISPTTRLARSLPCLRCSW